MFVILTIYALLAFMPLSCSELKLRQTNVICRHGARSPTNPIPNDPYKDVWPQGYGQLTKVGIQQMYHLGQYLRSHYQGFINSTYISDEIWVRSSNFDRTLMSGESMLAGLYPPTGFQIWNKEILWQPVPVHTVAQTDDILLDMDNTICPRYDKLRKGASETEEFKRENATYTEYYQYLKDMTGKTENMEPKHVWDVYDDLLSRETNGVPMPSWVTEKDMKIMADFFVPWDMNLKFKGLAKGRIKGGPLMTELVTNMNQSRNGSLDPPERRMFLYSGHDNNIVTTMQITKTYNERYVPYASVLLVELYGDDNDHFVMMKLRNDTEVAPFIINITVCGGKALCPLDEFITAVHPYMITKEQWLQECKLDQSNPLNLTGIIFLALAVAMMVFLLLGASIYLCKSGLNAKPAPSHLTDAFNAVDVRKSSETAPLIASH